MVNERIKLPAQEWLGYDPEKGDLHGYTFEQMREFAELIVQECANLCVKVDDANSDYPEFGDGAYFSAQRIKKHFGVEE